MWVKAVWEFKHSIRIFFLEDHRFAVRGASAAPGMEEESQRCRETTMSGGTKTCTQGEVAEVGRAPSPVCSV